MSKERITIGRRPHNDIVIDDLAISAEHAAIVTIQNDSLLEDLNSTNGTQINGQPVKKHFLQDKDVIELAHYRLTYVVGTGYPKTSAEKSLGAIPAHHAQNDQYLEMLQESGKSGASPQAPVIRILNGVSAGKEILLTKALTTIGRPGVQVAVITQRPQGYCITHVEGDAYPVVNGQAIGGGARSLLDGDVIDLSGTRMTFSLE